MTCLYRDSGQSSEVVATGAAGDDDAKPPELTELAVLGDHGDHSDHVTRLTMQDLPFTDFVVAGIYEQGLEQKDAIVSLICQTPVESKSFQR